MLLAATLLLAAGTVFGLARSLAPEPPAPDSNAGLQAGLSGPPSQSPQAWTCLSDCGPSPHDPASLGRP